MLRWIAVVVLCGTASAVASEPVPDARLQQAQTAYEEAKRLDEAGKYAEAVAQAERALSLRESVLGDKHPEVADCLDLLGTLYRFQGKFDRAEPLIQRGLAIREGARGPDHPEVAQSLNNLANVYQAQGKYDRAEPLYQRAVAIREAALGKNHPSVAASLNNLAVLYDRQGQYSRAEPLYQRALAIREAALGKDHPVVATSLGNLAILYAEMGLYSRAEPFYQRALAIREAALGKDHPDVAASLGNLANLYSDQGTYSRAEPLYQRALAIKEASVGKDHPDVAIQLNNLAVLYDRQGQYRRAEPLYQRALKLREAAFGQNHPDVAASLNNLAHVYANQGSYGRAEPLYQRSLAIYEAVLGKDNPEVGQTLNSLARVYAEQGQYGRAGPLYQRALATNEATLGKNHPAVVKSLNDLAVLQLARRRLTAAVPLLTRAFAVSEQRLRHEALDFSEARLASFLQLLRADEERLYALLRAHPDNASVKRLALSAALLLKGRSVEETANISRAVYRGLGAQERDTFERLRGLRTQLASLSLHGPGPRPLPVYQKQLQALAEQGDALEATLAQRSAPLREITALPSPAVIIDRVARALPRDRALIEFISYVDRPLVPGPDAPAAQLRSLALVLFPDATIRALDLGPAEPIDSAALRLRAALANRDAAFDTHAQRLYQLAFRPLLPLLGKTRRLFLSTDGQLALVPFSALHDGQQFLVESFDFTYLTSGKDLLPRLQQAARSSSVVVLADPDFDASFQHSASFQGEFATLHQRSAALEHFFSSRDEGSAIRAWATVPLPGTRQEAKAIQRLLPKAQLFLGAEATKQRLLDLSTPGILHLATHGFFLEDAAVPEGTRGVGHFGALGEEPAALRPPDPLLRSGLLLAGARAAAASSRSPAENALVTALELAGLDLWGTELVVLSACDTGRGDVKRGQGVYGMRRALMVAGAETVVTSLWKVDDQTTSTLMEGYYRNLLAGQGRATALREAMRALRTTQPHPHFWAPFIALGRDAPLRALSPASPPTPRTHSDPD
jgi:CHAT domain-containing protein/Tfp pilus assembly protein PilF